MKLCKGCNRPVDYSVCLVVSTNRLSPRFQKCSKAVGFCKDCLVRFLTSGEERIAESIRDGISPTFDNLLGTVERWLNAMSLTEECNSARLDGERNAA